MILIKTFDTMQVIFLLNLAIHDGYFTVSVVVSLCRLIKTVADINDQLDELKFEAEEILCSTCAST